MGNNNKNTFYIYCLKPFKHGCFSQAIEDAVITMAQHCDKKPSKGYDKNSELVHR